MTQQLPDFIEWRARDLASRVNSQDLTAVQVTQAALDRIAWANPLLNAFIDIDHVAVLKQAAAVDLKIQQGARLPLAGVPFSVKDNLWVAGRPATYGSKLYADHVAPRDSWSVEQLKKQEAICIGMTNTPEFACKGATKNPLHGITRNPWNLNLTPGGSSGGAVAGVAAGLVPPVRVRLRLRPPRRPRRRFFGPPGTWAPFCCSPDAAPVGCSGTEAPALISLMLLARFLTWIAHPRRQSCPPHALSSRSSATGNRFPRCPNRYRVYDLWRGPMPFLALRISPCS